MALGLIISEVLFYHSFFNTSKIFRFGINLFIETGEIFHFLNNKGLTPFHYALEIEDMRIIKQLLPLQLHASSFTLES